LDQFSQNNIETDGTAHIFNYLFNYQILSIKWLNAF